MYQKIAFLAVFFFICPLAMADNPEVQREIQLLQKQTQALQTQLAQLQKKLVSKSLTVKHKKSLSQKNTAPHGKANNQTQNHPAQNTKKRSSGLKKNKQVQPAVAKPASNLHSSPVTVHSLNEHPESVEFNPAALIADGHVVTYISGMPVVTSPYLGSLPAFDGSDYIVNISSINRDIRLMQQRRSLYQSYERMGYPRPNLPMVAISGKAEPAGTWHQSTLGGSSGDWTLGSGELDVAAAVNDEVEAYLALAYDESPPSIGGPRVTNSALNLNMGFINVGNLEESPYYFTAGQLYVPFGRFSTAMVSAPLTMRMARTKARPFILGYKSQQSSGPFAAAYAYKGETTLGNSAVGGLNLGYTIHTANALGEVGASAISSLNDVAGIQKTGSIRGTTFGGFASPTNGSENVHKVPGVGVHGALNIDRYSITAEWVSSVGRYHVEDLSFNGRGAQLQAGQLEGGVTFMLFDKPSSIGLGYQWSKETLALNLPQQRWNGVFNISIWKDTVESLEYRHDIDFGRYQYGNGAAPAGMVNANTIGTGGAADTLLAQIGVYF
jgi:hypothetical protein